MLKHLSNLNIFVSLSSSNKVIGKRAILPMSFTQRAVGRPGIHMVRKNEFCPDSGLLNQSPVMQWLTNLIIDFKVLTVMFSINFNLKPVFLPRQYVIFV